MITVRASPGYDLVKLAENGDIIDRRKTVKMISMSDLFEWVEMPETRA